MEEKENGSPDKREINQYFDMFFGLFNSFVMCFMISILGNNLVLVAVGYSFALIMATGIILTFIVKNPFYTYFTLGALVCGSFYTLPGLFVIPTTNFQYGIIDFIIFGLTIPEIYFIIILCKDSSFLEAYGKQALIRERAQYDSSLHYALMDPETIQMQQQQTLEAELKEQQRKQEYNKKYHGILIKSVSIISVIGFYSVYFSNMGL